MKEITYINGDATMPIGEGVKIIAHICNDIGGWGAGFVLAISKRWKKPENEYRFWHKGNSNFELGEIQLIKVEPEIYVANMIGQHGIAEAKKGTPPIRYNAVEECLTKLADETKEMGASVHMPRIGCGLAGGEWNKIESLINNTLLERDLEVYVYDFQ